MNALRHPLQKDGEKWTTTRSGYQYFINPDNVVFMRALDDGANGIYQLGNYKFLKSYVDSLPYQRSRLTLDIGCNMGMNLLPYSEFSEKVYGWEIQPEIADVAERIIQLNEKENITIFQNGLGSEPTTVDVRYASANDTEGYKAQDHHGTGRVNWSDDLPPVHVTKCSVNTLDSYNLTNVDVVKIDVEGYEGRVIEGAHKTFLSNRPIIQVEMEGWCERYGDDSNDIFNWFIENDFIAYDRRGNMHTYFYKRPPSKRNLKERIEKMDKQKKTDPVKFAKRSTYYAKVKRWHDIEKPNYTTDIFFVPAEKNPFPLINPFEDIALKISLDV